MAIVAQFPTPEQLPPAGQIVHQIPRPDLVQVCTTCGTIVAVGFEQRHAATHAENAPDA
jgi:hypothetical protein